MVFALILVLGVAVAVLPHRSGEELQRFPWFWVVFPLTCLAVGFAISGVLPGPTSSPGSGSARYAEGRGSTVDYFTVLNWVNALSISAAVVGTVLSFWAWRQRRV